jgi:hypothetical protein
MLCNNIIALLIICFVLFFIYNKNFHELFTDYMILPEEANIICARSCCISGWPTGIAEDIPMDQIGTQYIPTGESCITGTMDGCVCKLNKIEI